MAEEATRTSALRHGDVKRIFNAVVDLPPDQRDQALRQECGTDLSLRGAVMSLIEALDDSAGHEQRAVLDPGGRPGDRQDAGQAVLACEGAGMAEWPAVLGDEAADDVEDR